MNKYFGFENLEWRCKDCGRVACTAHFHKELGWISVKDRLPESYVFVLVCEKSERCGNVYPISIARWECDIWNGLGEDGDETNAFYSDFFWDIEWKEITHWMPLPEPPK